MIHRNLNSISFYKKHLIASISFAVISFLPVHSQIKYVPVDERKDAGMGVERMARLFTTVYESKPANNDNEIRWIQVDLGENKKIDGIKLLPRVNPGGYVRSIGFPVRFKIEVSDEKEFKFPIIYDNHIREDFRDTYDEIITFSGKEVYGRYVRLTALQLRQKRLALTKIMIMSDGKDIAVGCPISDSESGDMEGSVLTRPARPQGEGVVTDNPGNIIPSDRWNPVAYKAQAPKTGIEIDECKEPDGYIMAYPKNKIFSGEYGAYTRSWVTHGLIEAGYAGNEKAFPLLRRFYDWFNISCYLPEMLRRTGQGTQGIIPSTRIYFTPVGKPDDIHVVQQYFQENYWIEQLANRDPKAIWLYPYDRPHCYLITGIEPYLDMYRATGEKKYLDAASGAWDLYHDNWEHIGGSIAICEEIDLYPPKSYYLHRKTGELCGSVFWTFLNQRFHLLNPEEEKHVAEIEKSIYNNLIANQVGDKGIRYHSVLVDHKDLNNRQPWAMSTCCEGQGTRMMGALPEFIYSIADDGIYVNPFAPSTISHTTKTGTLTLKMVTQFPYDKKVQLTIKTKNTLESKIRIRIPSWAEKKMPVLVNGRTIVSGNPGSFHASHENPSHY